MKLARLKVGMEGCIQTQDRALQVAALQVSYQVLESTKRWLDPHGKIVQVGVNT